MTLSSVPVSPAFCGTVTKVAQGLGRAASTLDLLTLRLFSVYKSRNVVNVVIEVIVDLVYSCNALDTCLGEACSGPVKTTLGNGDHIPSKKVIFLKHIYFILSIVKYINIFTYIV